MYGRIDQKSNLSKQIKENKIFFKCTVAFYTLEKYK